MEVCIEAFLNFQSLFTYCLRQPAVVHKDLHCLYQLFINVFVFNDEQQSQKIEARLCVPDRKSVYTVAAKDKAKLCLTFKAARGQMEK